MGLTAEAVAQEFKVSREDQDLFALNSHKKATEAIEEGRFKEEIVPYLWEATILDEKEKRKTQACRFDTDEGPRKDTDLEALARLRPVFAQKGSVTAGNSSQTSDGAAFAVVMSERKMRELGLEPIARLVELCRSWGRTTDYGNRTCQSSSKALQAAGMKLADLDLIELNEAAASQSLAVARELDIDNSILNVNGGPSLWAIHSDAQEPN